MGWVLLAVWLAVGWNVSFPWQVRGDSCLGFAAQTLADACIAFPLAAVMLDRAWKLRRASAKVTAVVCAWVLAKSASHASLLFLPFVVVQWCQVPDDSTLVVSVAALVPLGAIAAQAVQADRTAHKLRAEASLRFSAMSLDG